MIHSIDDLFVDEIAIHAMFEERNSATQQPPTCDEQFIRQQCREIIADSYLSFATDIVENPVGLVYNVQKQQAITALKKALQKKAAAAGTAEERQVYLNYARVAHLQFAQKTKQLDAIVAAYNQEVPEPYLCSTAGTPASGICTALATAGLGLLGMANRRIQKKKEKEGRNGTALSSSPTIVPAETLAVSYTAGQKVLSTEGDDGVLVDDEKDVITSNGISTRGIVLREKNTGYVDTSTASLQARAERDNIFVDESFHTPTAIPVEETTEETPKPKLLPFGPPENKYKALEALAAEQQKPRRSILRSVAYSGMALASILTAGIIIANELTPSAPRRYETPREAEVSSVSIAPPITMQDQDYPKVTQDNSPYSITYESSNAPQYDMKNPAPWYQIEKADLKNNGKTVDLRLGPHLSMEGRTVRVNYDTTGDGKADRTKYVASAEFLSLTVSGKIIDVGVGFKNEERPGFIYHSSVRFDQKERV